MRGFFDDNIISIFGKDITFLSIFIFFIILLAFSLVIFILSFILRKKKGIEKQKLVEIEIKKIDEEINSIVKKYKLKETKKEEK